MLIDYIIRDLKALGVPPPAAGSWLRSAKDGIEFLNRIGSSDYLILFASFNAVLIHSVLARKSKLRPGQITKLQSANVFPSASWVIQHSWRGDGQEEKVYLEPPLHGEAGGIFDGGEKLIFIRPFSGVSDYEAPIEISQKLVHSLELFYMEERRAYCKLDDNGDFKEVIKLISLPKGEDGYAGKIALIEAAPLHEYMALANMALAVKFDFTRVKYGAFGGWNHQTYENYKSKQLIYNSGYGGSASFVNGWQIIHPNVSIDAVVAARKADRLDEKRQYAQFKILDWRHDRRIEVSCQPSSLTNYFERKDGLPYELSPAFFRGEVLQKYKADPKKYTLEDRSITCRGTWYLKGYDINPAGQVHAYVGDLARLPYAEQLYWSSFNEWPKGTISKRSFEADFEGKWTSDYDPLASVKRCIQSWDKANLAWWNERGDNLVSVVHYPATESGAEWANEILGLDQMIVEGFQVKALRRMLEAKGKTFDKNLQSLGLLQELLCACGMEMDEARRFMNPLRTLHDLRSKLKGHGAVKARQQLERQAWSDHGGFGKHFAHLAAGCHEALNAINLAIMQEPIE